MDTPGAGEENRRSPTPVGAADRFPNANTVIREVGGEDASMGCIQDAVAAANGPR